jgi:glycosyltransferase involved in cell wall biosynthesis
VAIKKYVPRIADCPRHAAPGESPLLSVVTTVRNGEKTLGRTIDSVRAQKLPGLEYIVVDAGSTDGTLDIVRASADVVTHWQSEPDSGISDGFNKGIILARGKYVTLLNADDWLSPGQLAHGVETLERTCADFVFGDLIYHDAESRALYRMRGEEDYACRIGHVMPALNHPSVIVLRTAYERFGLFDVNLKLAMDYELLLRFHRAGCRGVYDPRILGHMSLEGASDAQSRKALAEVRAIAIRHGGWPPREWLRFVFRIAKGEVRRLLEKILPISLVRRLRSTANRNFADLPQ